ncbi:MAG TPA: bifunctional metallophosphatase/5'-nucleotidase [Propionibacteriaceae bacterium]|nr:bifunctional metallophosphatase/5'-nucleotidase [Propionibacteriaceae bacterium]
MRLSRRFASITVAFAVVATSLGGVAQSAEAHPHRHKPKDVKLQVLSFNDFHGHLQPPGGTDATLGEQLDPTGTEVGGAEYLASTLTKLRAKARNSHTVAAGDLIGGSPFVSGLFHDEPAVESLNAMGMDVSGVGNHEFDEGVKELLRMQYGGCHRDDGCYEQWGEGGYPGADFPWLAANVVDEKTGKTVLPGSTIRRVQGVKVGYIGMTLEATPALVAQAGIRDIDFRDEVETANATAKRLKKRGVKTIIVLLHEGGYQTGTYRDCTGISGPIVEIAEDLDPEIDLVVTGHTHQPYVCNIPDPKGRDRMVTSAASYGRVVTETTLTINPRNGQVKRNKTTSKNHLVTRTNPDPTQTEIVNRWTAASEVVGNEVIGSITADINRSPDRNTEAPLGNLIADAQLAATSSAANGGAQIALMNPGGVRADLTYAPSKDGGEAPGEVTYSEAFDVQPFGNLLVTMDLTGAQIERLLEQQAVTGRPGGRDVLIFGVSGGFTFSYDAAAPVGSRIDPASVKLNGTTLDPGASYRIVTNSFLADGGDSFSVFTEGTNRSGGGDDLVALIDYLGANSPVAPPGNRIAGI